YRKGKDYDLVAFNNLWLQMTQGDIRTQAAGTLRMWAKYLKEQKAYKVKVNAAIKTFVSNLQEKDIQEILYDGAGNVSPFWFGQDWPQKEATAPGLKPFYQALKYNNEQGYIYFAGIDIVSYIEEVLKNKIGNHDILKLFNETNGSAKYYSALTPYEKQKAFIEILHLLVKESESRVNQPEVSVNAISTHNNTHIEESI
ncbi:MAG: hypothetical protein KKD05_01415, partial [Candidatus Omnitrophica bacterium]|nr:hypothetical protein [Candidatus Omnitrophota bacterium]